MTDHHLKHNDHAEDHGLGLSHKEVRAAHHAEKMAERAAQHALHPHGHHSHSDQPPSDSASVPEPAPASAPAPAAPLQLQEPVQIKKEIKQEPVKQQAPPLSADAQLLNAVAIFRERFKSEPTLATFAPGRVNLIGEHTDYNDGFVLPFALPFRTIMVGAKSATKISTIISPSQSNDTSSFEVSKCKVQCSAGIL
jgi:hypothetical protein